MNKDKASAIKEAKTIQRELAEIIRIQAEADRKKGKLEDRLEKLQALCPHDHVFQPNYFKVCRDCGCSWPGT